MDPSVAVDEETDKEWTEVLLRQAVVFLAFTPHALPASSTLLRVSLITSALMTVNRL